MPRTGSATYNGLMGGNVKNGKHFVHRRRQLRDELHFGTRFGTTSMNFDNRTHGGAVLATKFRWDQLRGGFASGRRVGTMGGRSMVECGQPGRNVLDRDEQPNYQASGIFAGQK